MKKLFTLLAIALFGVAMWSCSYDDDDLWKAVDDRFAHGSYGASHEEC